MEQIEPLSLNEFQSIYGGGVEEFSVYCLGYWLQQNQDKAGEKHYQTLQAKYEAHDDGRPV